MFWFSTRLHNNKLILLVIPHLFPIVSLPPKYRPDGPGSPEIPDLSEVRRRRADPTEAQRHPGHPSRSRQADQRRQDRELEEPDGARRLVEHAGRR